MQGKGDGNSGSMQRRGKNDVSYAEEGADGNSDSVRRRGKMIFYMRRKGPMEMLAVYEDG